jgi:glycine/D-amino acid oxidase-like deaminating enzyme
MGYGADEIYTRSAQHSLECWKELARECNQTLFHQTGILWLAHDDDLSVEHQRDFVACWNQI